MPILGLIGYPLGHSFSQRYFSAKFQREAIEGYSYHNFPIPSIDELPALLKNQQHLLGFNVTIPYKRDIMAYLNHPSHAVTAIGACNCVRIDHGILYGYNTDVVGFERSLQPFLKPHHQKALILGTGGAALAVRYVLDRLGIEHISVSRTAGEGVITYNQVTEAIVQAHLLVINTTPLGMYPEVKALPLIPYQFLTPQHHLYDLVYNPAITAFMHAGMNKGATVQNGEEMLHIQAEESWRIWTSPTAP